MKFNEELNMCIKKTQSLKCRNVWKTLPYWGT